MYGEIIFWSSFYAVTEFVPPPDQKQDVDDRLADKTDIPEKFASDEQMPKIQVTIKLSWNKAAITRPPPKPYTTTVLEGTVLRSILDQAAKDDHAYSYTTDYIRGLGDQLTSIGGLGQDSADRQYWMIYEKPGRLTMSTIDEFQPKDGSTTTFQLFIMENPKLSMKLS